MSTVIDHGRAVVRRLYPLKRWMYRNGRPGRVAGLMNRAAAAQYSAGLSSARSMTLEVTGRDSGKAVSLPVVVADYQGQRYLVSMLGKDANWVANLQATEGHAVLRRRGRQDVVLEEVEVGARAPILRRYLAVAPGARPHFPVDKNAPLAQFAAIAGDFPAYCIHPIGSARPDVDQLGRS
jgi:deazaflavin-dependent oxidoreductase (nitroreductase family)